MGKKLNKFLREERKKEEERRRIIMTKTLVFPFKKRGD